MKRLLKQKEQAKPQETKEVELLAEAVGILDLSGNGVDKDGSFIKNTRNARKSE